jgi:hypothetical protein
MFIISHRISCDTAPDAEVVQPTFASTFTTNITNHIAAIDRQTFVAAFGIHFDTDGHWRDARLAREVLRGLACSLVTKMK